MTALTLRVIWTCKIFPKFKTHLLYMVTSTLRQNLQEAAVTICSRKFGCPSQESLSEFKEHLFLMTAFKVYHICREHEEGSLKIGRVEGASFNVWESMGGRDSLEKWKYLANSYTAARVNVY